MPLRLSAVLASALLGTHLGADAQTPYACPPPGTSVPLLHTFVRLPRSDGPAALCLLLRRDAVAKDRRAPVARSYAGRAWEASAGAFAAEDSGVVVDCAAGEDGACDVTLPAAASGTEYALESHERAVSGEAEAARFLEQVSPEVSSPTSPAFLIYLTLI